MQHDVMANIEGDKIEVTFVNIGEKGEPFKYEDYTPEQLENLKGPQGDFGLISFRLNENMELEYTNTAVLGFEFDLSENKELMIK